MLSKIGNSILVQLPDTEYDQPCLYAIVGGSKTLMVDGGITPGRAGKFVDAVRGETGRGIDFVVVTHWHWDHVFGLPGVDAPIIGHSNLPANLQRLQSFVQDGESLDEAVRTGAYSKVCAEFIRKSYPDPKEIAIRLPDITIGQALSLDLGGVVCDVLPFPECHTDDSLAVWISSDKALIIGDALYAASKAGRYFYRASSAKALVELIDGSGAEWFMDSHQEPAKAQDFLAGFQLFRAASEGVSSGITTKAELLEFISSNCGDRSTEDREDMAGMFINGLSEE